MSSRPPKTQILTVLSDGRTAYYDEASGTEVIVNPNAGDFATTFVPRDPLLAVTLSHRANFFPMLRRMAAIESTNDFVHVNHLHQNELNPDPGYEWFY